MKNKEKILNIKVYESTHKILSTIKAQRGFKSFDRMFIDYFAIKEDIENENTKQN